VLFFEAAASRRQIRRVHQRDRVWLHALAAQQPLQQVLIDPAQAADADLTPKLVQHPPARPLPAQQAKPPPSGLFGQLRHDQIERMRRSQQRQQMRAPQLRCAQSTPSPAGELARAQIGNEVVGHIRRNQVQQAVGSGGWKRKSHARTLTDPTPPTNPPVLAKTQSG
jgi:hypothetical protein